MKRLILLAAVVALAGCASAPTVVPARAAIPVECKEKVPERDPMPTDALPIDASVDQFVQAAWAEIKLREAFEVKLVAALEACTKPISGAAD